MNAISAAFVTFNKAIWAQSNCRLHSNNISEYNKVGLFFCRKIGQQTKREKIYNMPKHVWRFIDHFTFFLVHNSRLSWHPLDSAKKKDKTVRNAMQTKQTVEYSSRIGIVVSFSHFCFSFLTNHEYKILVMCICARSRMWNISLSASKTNRSN